MTGIHILRSEKQGKTVAYQYPMYGKGEPTLFWALNGMVAFEDRRPGANPRTGTMSWQDAALRRLAVSEMCPKRPEDDKGHWRYEREQLVLFLEAMEQVIREAKEQGGPHDNDPHYNRRHKLKTAPSRINDDFLVQNNLLRKGRRQANGVVRLGSCDF